MSKLKKLPASKAIAKAKKNSLARKLRVYKSFSLKAADAIEKMIEDGVVSCSVFMTEEEQQWGLNSVQAELESLGYVVTLEQYNKKDEDEIPDMVISIEHLK
jgi:hypothetical protein